jgi:two-component system phosphate regulon sensor histidine kinase PhoR
LRGRIGLLALTGVVAALASVWFLANPGLRARVFEESRRTVLAEARLMARVVADALTEGVAPSALDPLVDAAAKDVSARVTIIDLDGWVIADSEVSGEDLHTIDNHGTRPEVLDAKESGKGTSVRLSATVGRELLYGAVLIEKDGRLLGYSRVARGLEDVEAQVDDLQRALLVALVLALTVAVLLSLRLWRYVMRPLERVKATAERLAEGDIGARIAAVSGDSFGDVSQALNRAADELQQRLEETARERQRSEAILSSMEDGLLAIDHRGVVIRANDSLREAFGVRSVLGRDYADVIPQPEVAEVMEGVLESGERRAGEVETSGHSFALTGVPFPGPPGSPRGVVLTLHDVTERRRLEHVRRDFVANASHELRTPLTSIRGFVEALEDGALQDPTVADRFLSKIRTHSERMTTLVQDLLELSRLESGQRPPRFEELDPAEVAEDVVLSFSALAQRSGLTLSHRGEGAPRVVSDRDRLGRILEALTENAVKYTPAGGHVELRTAPGDDGGALVEVIDDGPGIPEEHLPRLFERFYRVDKARSRELGGTGLGLSIARHLAEGMGAAVSVSSVVGEGSRFTVSLRPEPDSGTEATSNGVQLSLAVGEGE